MAGEPQHEPPDLRVIGADTYADWDALYRDTVGRIYRLAFRRLGNRPDAEDLTEEVMLRALRTLHLPAPRREVRSYLVKTLRSVLSEHWSQRHLDFADIEATAALDSFPATGDQARRVRALLDRLPERSRRVLELRFLQRRSVRDAARELGVTETHLKVLQYRALRQAAALEADAP